MKTLFNGFMILLAFPFSLHAISDVLCNDDLTQCTPAPKSGSVLLLNDDGKSFSIGQRTPQSFVGEIKMFELPSKAPVNCLPLQGQVIDAQDWPELVFYYTDDPTAQSVVLRDYRGEFVRGLDESRGVDPNRAPRTWQSDEFASHRHEVGNSTRIGSNEGSQAWGESGGVENQASSYTKSIGATETRPRNEAVHFCVMAGKAF